MNDRHGGAVAVNGSTASTVTRFSAKLLAETIPTWIGSELDAEEFHLPAVMPAGAVAQLRRAAAAHKRALVPATPDEIRRVLMMMRSGTIIKDETTKEARASLELLVMGILGVPLDILEAACKRYMQQPGQRFFPRSAGELREHTNTELLRRQSRASRLDSMAAEAERVAAEAERIRRENEATVPADSIDNENLLMRRLGLQTRFDADGRPYQLAAGADDPCDAIREPAEG